VPALHAVNNGKLVTAAFTAATRQSCKKSIDYLLAKSIIAFKFKHRLIEARLTSPLLGHLRKYLNK